MLQNQLCHTILVVSDLSNEIERERERERERRKTRNTLEVQKSLAHGYNKKIKMKKVCVCSYKI